MKQFIDSSSCKNECSNLNTMVVDVLLLSEPCLRAAELELEEDAPLALLDNFPLGKDLCNRSSNRLRMCR